MVNIIKKENLESRQLRAMRRKHLSRTNRERRSPHPQKLRRLLPILDMSQVGAKQQIVTRQVMMNKLRIAKVRMIASMSELVHTTGVGNVNGFDAHCVAIDGTQDESLWGQKRATCKKEK